MSKAPNELRPVKFIKNPAPSSAGSVQVRMGNTWVICGVSVDERIPGWMRAEKVEGGWLTAEYSMLPYSSGQRSRRETNGRSGRSQEIQRLIGRSLRAVVDLKAIGPRSIWVDCDVVQADGGTRTASITGGYVALCLAVKKLMKEGKLDVNPIQDSVAAVSVGIVHGKPVLDLCYEEDFAAAVDMNVVMTGSGKFVEVQGTAEESPYSKKELDAMLKLAEKGIVEITELQNKVIG